MQELIPFSEMFSKPNAEKGGVMRFIYAIQNKENIEGVVDSSGNIRRSGFKNSNYYKIMNGN